MKRYKYPRTYHLPYSPGITNDDKVLKTLDHFIGQEIVVTEKMDGENTTLYPDYYLHARSIDSKNHPSRDWVKAFHSGIAHKMDANTRICGENLYAKHSIEYNELESYFYAFSVWTDDGWCFSWDKTKDHLEYIGIAVVPELWRGVFDKKQILKLAMSLDLLKQEGLVIRTVDGFLSRNFNKSVAKYVRANHVQTEDHWINQQTIPNKLRTIIKEE